MSRRIAVPVFRPRPDGAVLDHARHVGSPERRDRLGRQHAVADLVFLDRLEKRLEVPLPESVVALPLDELEEDRPNDGLGEALQEYLGGAAVIETKAVNEDYVIPHP